MSRTNKIIKASGWGIAGNVLISAFKFVVGFASNSSAIVLDGLNSLKDALAFAITLVGIKLADKEPDRNHPFGYGRVEFLATLAIEIFILFAGISSARFSILRIFYPVPKDYHTLGLIIIAVAAIVQIGAGLYTKRKGKELGSEALAMSGGDATDASILSFATLAAALIYVFSGVSIEPFVALAIAIYIIRGGVKSMLGTLSTLLGKRISAEEASAVKKSIMSFPEVEGVFDLVIHNYGNDRSIASAHVEVPDVLTAAWIDNLQREITKTVKADTGIEMRGITIFANNTRNPEAVEARVRVTKLAQEKEGFLAVRGFFIDEVDKVIRFVLVVDFDVKNVRKLRDDFAVQVGEMYPHFDVDITIEHDISD